MKTKTQKATTEKQTKPPAQKPAAEPEKRRRGESKTKAQTVPVAAVEAAPPLETAADRPVVTGSVVKQSIASATGTRATAATDDRSLHAVLRDETRVRRAIFAFDLIHN